MKLFIQLFKKNKSGWEPQLSVASARFLLPILAAAVLSLASAKSAAADTDSDPDAGVGPDPVLRLGIVIDFPDKEVEMAVNGLVRSLTDMVGDRARVVLEKKDLVAGDGSVVSVRTQLHNLLAKGDLSIVIAFGLIASNEAIHLEAVPIPVFAPFVLDPVLQQAPLTAQGTSGVKNLTYLPGAPSFNQSLRVFSDAIQARRITVVTDALMEGMTASEQKAALEKLTRGAGVALTVLGYNSGEFIKRIPADSDGVFLFPLFEVPAATKKRLFGELAAAGHKFFSWGGYDDVSNGALMTYTDKIDLERINRRLSLTVSKMVENAETDLAQLKVGFVERGRISINLDVARTIGFEPSKRLLTGALLVGSKKGRQQDRLTLKAAVLEALDRNLTYLAARAGAAAGHQDLWAAWTRYFPTIFVRAGYTGIDDDTATIAAQQRSQHELTGEFGFTQPILDYRLIANIAIEHALEDKRAAELDQTRQDIMHTAASVYYQVQMAAASVEITRANLQVTEYNLSMAQRKFDVGLVGPGEVYRWESQHASERQELLAAENRELSARYVLNRILHRPIEASYHLNVNDIVFGEQMTGNPDWDHVFNSAAEMSILKEFVTEMALETAPELKQYDAAIRARKKESRMHMAGFVVPSIGIQGTVGRRLWDQKADGAFDNMMPNDNAVIAATLNWNIFEGGARIASAKKAKLEAAKLKYDREHAVQLVRENIYTGISNIIASRESVRLAEISSNAAQKGLEISSEAYGLGAIPRERLIDSQRQAFVASQALIAARFQLKLVKINLMRAANRLEILFVEGGIGDKLLADFKAYKRSQPRGPRP